MDAIEQYPDTVKHGENTNKIVAEVAKMVHVDLDPDQISTSHRLPANLKPQETMMITNPLHQPPPPIMYIDL